MEFQKIFTDESKINFSAKLTIDIYTEKYMTIKSEENSALKKILLAEDDNSMRRFLEVLLQKSSYDVTAAKDGLEALEIALGNDFDAIVADAMMPNMTGYDLCRMIRRNDGKKEIPFIILSGFEQDEADDEECLADAYLTKENNIKATLIKTLNKFLDENTES